jgi:hypothetical protein
MSERRNSGPMRREAPGAADVEQGLQELAAELKKLETEYNMYFAGRLPRPPFETRQRVDGLLKKWDRAHIDGGGRRFRLSTLQARFSVFADLWDRGLRAREEGRPGPFSQIRAAQTASAAEADRVVHVAAFVDPMKEIDKLEALYESLMDARRTLGGTPVPFHKFAGLVKEQVSKLREAGSAEVAFRVAVQGGKLSLTARAMRGVEGVAA